MPQPAKNTLSLVASPSFKVAAASTQKLMARTIKEIIAVAKLESQASIGATIAGLDLHRTKASVKHGQFGSWINTSLAAAMKWTPGTATTNASYYMRLATAFYEQAGMKEATIIAALDGNKGAIKALIAALKVFVGDLSLTELLIQHGIKGVGLKTALEDAKNAGGRGHSLSAAEKASQARTQAWEESWTSTQRLRAAFSEPEKLQLLDDPKQLETLKAELVEINKLADERITALRSAKPSA